VNHVVAHDDLIPFALAMAADITAGDAPAVARILQTYAQQDALVALPARQIESDAQRVWLRSGRGSAAEIDRRRTDVVALGRQAVADTEKRS
jgi:enoyl-CoA hydratase